MFFDTEVNSEGNVIVVKISGELCSETVGRAQAIVAEAADRSSNGIVFDMSGLDFLDSKGAGFLLQMKKNYTGKRAVALAGVQGTIKAILTRLMITEQFKVYHTVEDAVNKM